jgi:hypothetical protein
LFEEVAGKMAVIVPELAELETELAPMTLNEFSSIPEIV